MLILILIPLTSFHSFRVNIFTITAIMDNYLLPATRYEPPIRQARKHVLNTIVEDEHSEDEDSYIEEDGGRGRARNSINSRSVGSISPVPSLTSTISSYYRNNRRSQDFDELYDVSDDDSIEDCNLTPSRATYSMSASSGKAYGSKETRNRYPSIVIPSPSQWPTIQKLQKISPMISPAPPPKIPLSPAVLSLLSRNIPSSSQPPSLDGSLISDPLACSTAPVTPDMQNHPGSGETWGQAEIQQRPNSGLFHPTKDPEYQVLEDYWDQLENFVLGEGTIVRDFGSDAGVAMPDSPVLGTDDNVSDAGVQLPAEALLTLQHLSLDIPVKPDFAADTESVAEMEEIPFEAMRRRTVDMTPISQISDYSLDQLSIPSPGGFFSSLGSNARHTWACPKSRPGSLIPPSSTIAEQFYNCPWNIDPQSTVEQILEVDDHSTEGPPTARPISLAIPIQEHAVSEISRPSRLPTEESVDDCDEDYEQGIQQAADNSLDRTSIWLAAQSSYMAALRETNPVNEVGLDSEDSKRVSRHLRSDCIDSPMKKAVRFLETETAGRELTSEGMSHQGDSVYYHAFQHISKDTNSKDAFRHGQARSDAVQASRNCLPHEHLERLQGNYAITRANRPAPLRPISMFPGKDADENEQTTEQKVISRVEKERQALEQLNTSVWVVEASRFLNGGKLLNSPAIRDLAGKSYDDDATSCMRILDHGGLPSCDWAWHCAREYPNSKVYTATTEMHLIDTNIRGPRNHRCVSISKLWELPYPDSHFDAISARSLFTYLKNEKPLGQAMDEYDLCLRECLRCLKPGGYLEFFLLDSELVNAGSRGTAISVEFGFNLKTRGYDPAPTKNWLGRVRRAGFDDIKRAWTFLPMGAPPKQSPLLPETPPPDVATYDASTTEAVQGPVGSTADVANVAGLVGSWAWEQWMLKLEVEMGRELFLQGLGAVLEEGKFTGAGWRCLSGWARKPGGRV